MATLLTKIQIKRDTYENLKVKYPTFENATITVYLDQTNTNIYYVDLNSVKLNDGYVRFKSEKSLAAVVYEIEI